MLAVPQTYQSNFTEELEQVSIFLNFASDNNLLTAEKGVNIKTGGLVKEIEFSADFPCHPLS